MTTRARGITSAITHISGGHASVQPSDILKTEIEPYHTNRPCYVQGTFNIPEDKIQEESLKFAFADGPIRQLKQ